MKTEKKGIPITGEITGWFIPFTDLDANCIERVLIMKAIAVRENAYAPVTGVHVGAAIEAEGGNQYIGCNVENDTLSQTIHAEENAIGGMIAAGDKRPIRVAIAVARKGVVFDTTTTVAIPESLTFRDFPPTCPQCLQIISQHCKDGEGKYDPTVELISITPEGGVFIFPISTALTMPLILDRL
ncbi:hypothetical protein KKB10_03925 [Patescibacteria group bacterium]|nr:hypothetical protein [Patescibacteria group bacterium]MBU1075596.1 hypothetical protein [Patescibacteria group bacterium]MBU1951921.1 hypothetical protein [Patescibacteria group bacterium]